MPDLKKAFLLLLLLVLICSLFACGKTEESDETQNDQAEEETNVQQEPIMICGRPISSYVVLKDDNTDASSALRSAVKNFSGVNLQRSKTAPEDGRMIRFETDSRISPAACRIYTEGNTLVVAAYRANFLKQAATAFGTLLVGEQVRFDAGYDQTLTYTPVSYESVKDSTLKLTGDSDKDPMTYTGGETAVIHVAAVSGDQIVSVPKFKIVTYVESTQKSDTTYVSGTKGYCSVTLKSKRAGVAYCTVTACDADGNALNNFTLVEPGNSSSHYMSSVIFDMGSISVAARPDDYLSFWQGVTAEVRAMAIEIVSMEEIESLQDGYKTYYVALRCGTDDLGRPGVAAGYLSVPNGTGKIGLQLRFQSYGYDRPDRIYQSGTATFSVCSHSVELDKYVKGSDYYNEMYNSIAGGPGEPGFGQRTNITRDTIYFKQMLMRDLLAVRFMVQYFGESGNGRWNGVELSFGGTSMGGFQSMATAALTPYVADVVPSNVNVSIPWMCDLDGYNVGRKLSSFRPPRESATLYYDTVYFAAMIVETCRVNIECHLGDSICPASGVTTLYNAVRGPKKITFVSNSTHGGGWDGTSFVLQNE